MLAMKMIEIRTSFNGLKAGETFFVSEEFADRFWQYVRVIEEPEEESDGESDDLQGEGELPGA